MSWRDGFHRAVKEYLESRSYRPIKDIAEVISVEGTDPDSAYCPTCGPDPTTVDIYYIDTNGKKQYAFEYMSIGEFINSLGD